MRKNINNSDDISTSRHIVDFHSHILPGVDDGSRSVQESLEMINMSIGQGVRCMVATPHFYSDDDTLERFLERRLTAWNKLKGALTENHPEIVLGAEVTYFGGISAAEEVRRLAYGNILLVEMPFSRWNERMIDDVVALREDRRLNVVLAHIERYIDVQKRGVIDYLAQSGVIIQSNASHFIDKRTRRRALKMLERGQIHILGSDCHNIELRPPKLGEACDIIAENLGQDMIRLIKRRSMRLFETARGEKVKR